MSDVGGKENGKECTRKSSGKEDFVGAIAKIAVAQICENEGFQSFQHSAVEALADVGVRYMKEVGKTSNRYANQQGRSECNVFDVIQGLEDLNSIQGFPGASDVHHSVANSGIIREISQYVSLVEGVEFVFSLPRFPVSRERIPPSSFLQKGKDPPHHIPAWLPAFPCLESESCGDSSTGVGEGQTDALTPNKQDEEKEVELVPNNKGEAMNAQQLQQQHERQQQQEQQQLQQQQQQQQQQQHEHLVANNGSEVVAMNPFLAVPFAFGEKAVSLVEPPSRIWEGNHVNVMNTYATPIPETTHNEVSEIEETNKHIKLDGRPTVRLQFSSARKSLRTCKNVVAQTNGVEKLAISFERDDESDEMRRRAEQILKDSMDTPLDTTEL